MEAKRTMLESPDRVLSTLEKDGSRRWLYPRLAVGRFHTWRRVVAYALIAIFTLIPYIPINGRPAILLDIIHRRFHLFGYTFLPTDTVLLALFMVTLILTVFFMTALLGRVWCGWGCPQTVYMEFVFRPLERLFGGKRGVGGKPAGNVAAWRSVALYACYILVCLYLAHTFLAYFVGVEALRTWITRSPLEHPAAFGVMAATTALMLFDFLWFREQTCIIACPYGRLQSVLIDPNSLIIGYDAKRGEPRGKGRVGTAHQAADGGQCPPYAGDGIDCGLCVAVCPTGIDIRDGLQCECIGCAQCIDACDGVMAKIKRPAGLVRYSSQNAMAGMAHRILRPRVAIYCAVILGLMSVLTFKIVTKSLADVHVQRNFGRPFIVTDGMVENDLRVKITNRDSRERTYSISVAGRPDIRVVPAHEMIRVAAGESVLEPVRILVPPGAFGGGRLDVTIRVSGGEDVVVDRDCRLLGPSTPLASSAVPRNP